jgi:hypothetical protein
VKCGGIACIAFTSSSSSGYPSGHAMSELNSRLQVLLPWDDEGNDRQMALDLFDAFGSEEKTLHANMGGHTGVPEFEGDAGNRFFARHLT